MTKGGLEEEFKNRFSKKADHIFFCPGRVNLIGEHIDYNGGQVMPCAISFGTWVLISKNTDKLLRFQSLNFPETAELPLQPSYSKTGKEWFNYPLGVIHELLQEGHTPGGMDMLFYGNLPIGAGVSSSASIEVLMAFACSEIFQFGIDKISIALLGKKAENEFIGVSTGIMDQFAVAMGKKGKAILLNCDTLDYQYLPFEIGDYTLAIINSNKQRTLTDSKYNERFAQCRAALKLLQKELPIENLCDISLAEFEKHRHLITDPVLEKRARHVVAENERVKQAAVVMKTGNLSTFGELMYASHQSLKELYEVSGKELDTIVEFCKNDPHCIGARMTGAGFGGCAIALVKKDQLDEFSQQISSYYYERIGYKPDVFGSEVEDGVVEK